MKNKVVILGTTLLLLSFSGAWAQETDEGDEAESTIRLMDAAEAELPDAVTKEITLPDAVGEDAAAVEKAARGLDKANEKAERREKGLNRADEAREQGAEMADEARDKRENRGRSEDRPDPPNPPKPPNK